MSNYWRCAIFFTSHIILGVGKQHNLENEKRQTVMELQSSTSLKRMKGNMVTREQYTCI